MKMKRFCCAFPCASNRFGKRLRIVACLIEQLVLCLAGKTLAQTPTDAPDDDSDSQPRTRQYLFGDWGGVSAPSTVHFGCMTTIGSEGRSRT
jgi:hypothetical protein